MTRVSRAVEQVIAAIAGRPGVDLLRLWRRVDGLPSLRLSVSLGQGSAFDDALQTLDSESVDRWIGEKRGGHGVVLPLVLETRLLGVLTIAGRLAATDRAWLDVVTLALVSLLGAADAEEHDESVRAEIEEALALQERASSQVRALKGTLDALATEASPERWLAHILATIQEQFGTHGISVWLKDTTNNLIGLEYAYESGKLVPRTDPRFAGLSRWLPMEDIWPWPEVFRTGEASLIEDIKDVPPFPLRDRLIPMGIVTVLLVPMTVAGNLEGAVGLRFAKRRSFRREEIELAQALANHALLMIHFTRLSTRSRETAVIAERNRLARDIHDTLAQGFTGVIVQLEAAEDARARGLAEEAADHLGRARELARESLGEARRSVRALRPKALDLRDLCEALETLFRTMTHGTTLKATLAIVNEPRTLPAEWDEHLFRIGQEVLTNTLRHASANHFEAELAYDDRRVRLQMRDNGRGFDASARSHGHGLAGIKERVDAMGGQLAVLSSAAEGTTVTVTLESPDVVAA
jgi:signal transduction histidine kinase